MNNAQQSSHPQGMNTNTEKLRECGGCERMVEDTRTCDLEDGGTVKLCATCYEYACIVEGYYDDRYDGWNEPDDDNTDHTADYKSGYEASYQTGRKDGYAIGYDDGYRYGHKDGLSKGANAHDVGGKSLRNTTPQLGIYLVTRTDQFDPSYDPTSVEAMIVAAENEDAARTAKPPDPRDDYEWVKFHQNFQAWRMDVPIWTDLPDTLQITRLGSADPDTKAGVLHISYITE